MRAVTLVGIGDDGCVGLSARAVNAVARAQVLVGGERHLAFFPQFDGERIKLVGGKLGAALEEIARSAEERDVCVLASGDPLFFGVGALVATKVGADHVTVIPHPSSVQEAFARLGLKWDDAEVISLHGRSRAGLLTRLRRSSKVAILTDAKNEPAALARHLLEGGEAGWTAHVCENLCGAGERVRRFTLEALAVCEDVDPRSVLVLSRDDPAWRPAPVIAFLPEGEFEKRMPKRGLITKREARLLSIAAMQLRANSVVWDVGAGSGSVGIEAALLAYEGHAYLVEVDPESAAMCRENARALGADNVTVTAGRAPAALAGLRDPDAVFIGGSKGSMQEIADAAFERVRAGGRVVANAITLENVAECHAAFKRHVPQPEVTLISVARGEPLARYQRYAAQNPIHVFAGTKSAGRAGA